MIHEIIHSVRNDICVKMDKKIDIKTFFMLSFHKEVYSMYNDGRKKEYLAYKKQEYLRHLFVDSETYEKELGKDLCEMNTSELLHYLLRYDGYRTFEDKRRQISNYAEWCVIKGYAPMNWIAPRILPGKRLKEIYVSAKDDCYISREKFSEYLGRLKESCYGVYIASVFWCIYEGISGKGFYNLANLRIGDIDIFEHRINLADGSVRKVPEELIHMLTDTADVTEITNEKTVRYVSSLYPDSIWKLRKNDSVTFAKVQRKFIYLVEEMKRILEDDRLSKTAVERSGYFNRIYYRVLADGIDIRTLEFGADKRGREENASYRRYFEGSGLDMDMRKFRSSYQSYLRQV